MIAKVTFEDGVWKSDSIVINPDEQVVNKGDGWYVVEYTVKVRTLRCYYDNEKKEGNDGKIHQRDG